MIRLTAVSLFDLDLEMFSVRIKSDFIRVVVNLLSLLNAYAFSRSIQFSPPCEFRGYATHSTEKNRSLERR